MKPTRKERLDFWFGKIPLPYKATEWMSEMTPEERNSFFLKYLRRLKEVMDLEELLIRETVRDEKHLQKIVNILRTAFLASLSERTRLVIQVTQMPSGRFVPSLEELEQRK